ncbi:Chl4 protein [Martiniozyma asiatica (nom. inval.)]|nr:Chl4 protein [Martiniozyma asiatica]
MPTPSGILPNYHIPPLTARQITRELNKLNPDTLHNLVKMWLTLHQTQPKISSRDTQADVDVVCKGHLKKVDQLKRQYSKNQFKKKIIDHILIDFWPNGLNTLQLAQIDVQTLIERPNVYSWMSSTAKIVNNLDPLSISSISNIDELQDYIFSLDSQSFLNNFIKNLSNLYLTHIYISRHPRLPLFLMRIQMYEKIQRYHLNFKNKTRIQFENDFQNHLLNADNKSALKVRNSKGKAQQQIVTSKPHYILLPFSSPHVIYSCQNNFSAENVNVAQGNELLTTNSVDDLTTKLLLQTLESTISSSSSSSSSSIPSSFGNGIQIRLFNDTDNKVPLKNLNSIFLLKGISRFGKSLGAWIPYADGQVDVDVLSSGGDSVLINPGGFFEPDHASRGTEAAKERQKVSALRFKGSARPIKTRQLFETVVTEHDQHSKDQDLVILDDEKNEIERMSDPYSSIIPIRQIDFELKGSVNLARKNNKKKVKREITVSLKFLGSDIYGGLHELADQGFLDAYTAPNWITGEEGIKGGIIKNGKLN